MVILLLKSLAVHYRYLEYLPVVWIWINIIEQFVDRHSRSGKVYIRLVRIDCGPTEVTKV